MLHAIRPLGRPKHDAYRTAATRTNPDGVTGPSPGAGAHVVVACPSAMCRFGMSHAVHELLPGAAIDECDDVDDLAACLRRGGAAALVLYGLTGPDVGKLSRVGDLVRSLPDVPVVVFGTESDCYLLAEAIAQGARGAFFVTTPLPVLWHIIGLVMAGETYVPSALLGAMRPPSLPATIRPADGAPRSLTPRQRQIATMIARGRRNKEIARDLELREGTVKVHVKAIFRTLNVAHRRQIAAVAALAGGLGDGAGAG